MDQRRPARGQRPASTRGASPIQSISSGRSGAAMLSRSGRIGRTLFAGRDRLSDRFSRAMIEICMALVPLLLLCSVCAAARPLSGLRAIVRLAERIASRARSRAAQRASRRPPRAAGSHAARRRPPDRLRPRPAPAAARPPSETDAGPRPSDRGQASTDSLPEP